MARACSSFPWGSDKERSHKHPSAMQERVDSFGQLAIDAAHTTKFLDAGGDHARVSAERFQQRRAPGGADAGHLFQHAALARLFPPLAVPGDREAMRLVAHGID